MTESMRMRHLVLAGAVAIMLCAAPACAQGFLLTVEIITPATNPVEMTLQTSPDTPPDLVAIQEFEAVAYLNGQELAPSEVAWDWDFDDGTEHSADNPTTHHYTECGAYIVVVEASLPGGWSALATCCAFTPPEWEPTYDEQEGWGVTYTSEVFEGAYEDPAPPDYYISDTSAWAEASATDRTCNVWAHASACQLSPPVIPGPSVPTALAMYDEFGDCFADATAGCAFEVVVWDEYSTHPDAIPSVWIDIIPESYNTRIFADAYMLGAAVGLGWFDPSDVLPLPSLNLAVGHCLGEVDMPVSFPQANTLNGNRNEDDPDTMVGGGTRAEIELHPYQCNGPGHRVTQGPRAAGHRIIRHIASYGTQDGQRTFYVDYSVSARADTVYNIPYNADVWLVAVEGEGWNHGRVKVMLTPYENPDWPPDYPAQ